MIGRFIQEQQLRRGVTPQCAGQRSLQAFATTELFGRLGGPSRIQLQERESTAQDPFRERCAECRELLDDRDFAV